MRIGRIISAIMSVGVLLAAGFHSVAYAQQSPESSRGDTNPGIKNIVLVHGAWADGSSWSKVIPSGGSGIPCGRSAASSYVLKTMMPRLSVLSRASRRHTQVVCCWSGTLMGALSSETLQETIQMLEAWFMLLHLLPIAVNLHSHCWGR